MQNKSTRKPTSQKSGEFKKELIEHMTFGVTEEGEFVYIHGFDDNILALEFMETAAAGLRADILSTMFKRSMN